MGLLPRLRPGWSAALPQLGRRHVLGRGRLPAGGPTAHRRDSAFQVKVTSIDGTVRDSIRVAGPGNWIDRAQRVTGRAMDRGPCRAGGPRPLAGLRSQGNVADRVINSCTCPGRITPDALWLTRSGWAPNPSSASASTPRPAGWRRAGHPALGQLQQLQRHRRRLDAGRRRRHPGLQPLGDEAGRRAEGRFDDPAAAAQDLDPGPRAALAHGAGCCSAGPCPAAPAAPTALFGVPSAEAARRRSTFRDHLAARSGPTR